MPDILRDKYARLMSEVEDLEARVDALGPAVAAEEARSLRERLAEKKNELARLSDGCGKPTVK